MSDINSIHLQNFPNVSDIMENKSLMEEMDMVRDICSMALFIRDKENLRVRLPLNFIKIIGNNIDYLNKYNDIIADEINVKNVIIVNNLDDIGEFIIEVDLKKLGEKFGAKLKDIIKAVKENKWKKLENDQILVADAILERDEYTIKLQPKKKGDKEVQALHNNKAIVILDLNITPELELEGMARDLVRMIQQNRKDANLNLSDRIYLFIKTSSEKIAKAINFNKEYIQNQTLAKDLKIVNEMSADFSFGDDFNNDFVNIGFTVVK